MTSLKRSQTERSVATGVAVGTDGASKVHTDDFYMRRFRSQNGSLGSAVMAPVGPPRSEGSHHLTSTPGVPKMGVRARIADWPPRKDNVKETSRSSQDIETASCLDSMSSKSSPGSQGSSVNLNASDSVMLKSIQNTLKNKTRQSENLDSRFLTPDGYPSSPRKALRRIRQRSNSDITLSELDVDSFDECISPTFKSGPSLHREYGSTSSIDKQGTSGESFFDLIKGYKDEKSDQRSPAPAKFSELLIASGSKGSGFSLDVIDGPITQRENLRLFKEREKPLKRRSKSETGDSSIFRKLRNAKGEGELSKSSDLDDNRLEDSLKPWTCPKCFAHYDVQSILFDLNEAALNRHNVIKRRNTTTGASAAAAASLASGPLSHSASFNSPMGSTEDLNSKGNLNMDQGDDKSNELVMSCPYFRNEIGGEGERKISLSKSNSGSFSGCESASFESTLSSHCTNAGVAVLEVPKENLVLHLDRVKRYIVEHVDLGAYYYRKFFYQKEHWNYFGVDESLGPVAVSIRREKPDEIKENGPLYNYRIIFRTSELLTLRGSVLEDAIPSTAKHCTARGLPLKEVLEHVVPELNIHCLRLAFNTPKVTEQLMKLDEQGLSYQLKVGIMYCKAGQSTEEEMYNNESAGPAFEEFLQLLGERVRLKGFEKYRAQLDTKTDSTGTHSLYTTYKDYEIMFHVSTMLPYTPNNKQQLLRKRHIGNDIVTIVFQETGAQPFSPKNIRSHFQHVFVIVRVHNPCTDNICYSVAVTRSRDVPSFGPPIPKGVTFPKSNVFRDFLLAKVINAENAAHKSEKFRAMATRTRQEYLKDLAEKNVTNTPIDPSGKFPFISLASKKKEKSKPYAGAELNSSGAIVWSVHAKDYCQGMEIDCLLGVSNEFVVLIEQDTKSVVFNCSCRDVIGWTSTDTSIKLFYDRGECVSVESFINNLDDIKEVVKRLEFVTKGCETTEMTLRRNGLGQLGFHVNYEGIVADVEPYGYAWQAGLRQGSRLVEICKVAVATLSHEQMIDLLRTSVTVKVVIIPPHEDCTPRRSCSETCRMPVMEYKMNEGVPYEFKFPFRNNNKWQRNANKGQGPHMAQVPSQIQSPVTSRIGSGKGEGKMPPQERAANIPRSISSDGRPLDSRRLPPGSDVYVTVSSIALARSQQCRNSPSNLLSSSETGSGGGTYRQKSMPEGFGMSRRSPASIDRQSTQTDTSGSGKSTPSWQRSEDSIADQMEPTCHLPAVSKVLPSFRDSPSGRLIRQDPVVHLSPNKQGHSDSHYSSHSSSNTLSSNASSAHSDEKWYDSGDRTESELNSYNYLQGTSADSGIDTTSYGPSHGSTASLGTSATSPRSGLTKEKVAPLWHSSSEVVSIADRTLEKESHVIDRKSESSLSLDIHTKNQPASNPLTRENSAYSLSDAVSHTSTMSSRHSASPVVFTSARSSPKEELHSATSPQLAPSFSSSSSSSSGPRTFYPRQGATSKYLIGWKKPGGTINSVGFMDSRKRHQSDGNEMAHPRLRASARDLRASPKRASKSNVEEELKKLIDLDSPTPESQKNFKSPFPSTPTTKRALQRTLSDESIYSGQREHFFTSRASLLDQALPNDVLFSSTYPSLPKSLPLRRPSYTLGMKSLHGEFSASDSSLTDIQEQRKQPMPDPGLMPLPDSASDLDWSNLVDAAKAFEVQRASFFAASDENRPVSSASNSDQTEEQLTAQMKPYTGKESPPTLASKVDQLEGLLKMLQEDLKREKEDKASLQAEVQHLREDNLRLQEESQSASEKLKKFTEWVFNTIDMT
ncbi:signal-induced proliferation-associated 1-like protein 1 isoform X1 [Pelodiscus sinensis]|uniref:signal-induced proliferation-associated 1-like protein 1 isoform X1 n=1 Tax=Pelodiscus sinensis TaxID=13735 RepID=UPI0003C485A9|nr:signal-induced proliferation-associated 1-like protein 1 [Pelodiscus sinensis]XP_025044089.1 signal-induced proliferation-associated 1-like protein 1 [Pelodiscus sinensis]XP_025044090.1 signal-induced proliferation-associated 1-like protein 1 [Pelodiscus sinensis]XP_025044091.1 signal-induced proliferation-associated 1-like protein 1 [Pelodiscus sinensis]XP_025044092.1 signal-induced proliferation-associated 1-like protein 1 [Pelodiscus sinensis]XP_025044093.1 signal-induced proliferation-a|eukprot:XP_025044088.1 signal-induced proliferation-associated 1-like protein 1 [Pelodiscus sinensis]